MNQLGLQKQLSSNRDSDDHTPEKASRTYSFGSKNDQEKPPTI